MRSVLFEIGPVKVYSYGLMIIIGVFVAISVGEERAKRRNLDKESIFPLAMWCLFGGLLGAKLLYFITEWRSIVNGGLTLYDILYGFVVYGGIIFGILTGYLFCKKKKFDFLKYFDLVMPSIAIAQGFGRIGCFLAGCCYGKETHAWYGMEFNHSVYESMREVKVIPTQLISSAANFLNFFILFMIAKKVKKDGVIAGLYLVFYSIGRFFIEFLRDDPRGTVGGLSTSQFISVLMFVAGTAMVTYFAFIRKQPLKAPVKINKKK